MMRRKAYVRTRKLYSQLYGSVTTSDRGVNTLAGKNDSDTSRQSGVGTDSALCTLTELTEADDRAWCGGVG